jgi:hypothetical protein
MAGMAGMDEASAHLVMTAAEPMSLTPDVAAAIGAVSGDERSLMRSTFEGRCTSNTAADMCTIVAALTVPTLLGLLLGASAEHFSRAYATQPVEHSAATLARLLATSRTFLE